MKYTHRDPAGADEHRGRAPRLAGMALWVVAGAIALAPAHGQATRPDVRTGWPAARPVTGVGHARQNGGAQRTGFRLDAGVTYGRPFLDEGGKSTWERVGTFEAGAGVVLGLGYDRSRWGVSVVLDAANSGIGGRNASSLTFAALAHWYPTTPLGGAMTSWHPQVTIGYVRQGLGGVRVTRDELPASLAEQADPFIELSDLGVLGNGVRLGVAVERAVRGPFALQVGVTTDVVSFGTATVNGFDQTLRPSGRSIRPSGSIGIVWRPF